MRYIFILYGFVLYISITITVVALNGIEYGSQNYYTQPRSNDKKIHGGMLKQYTGHIHWMSWKELVYSVHSAKCTLLNEISYSLHHENKTRTINNESKLENLSRAYSASSSRICHLPIMLFFHRDDCPACQIFLQNLGESAEFELLSEYMSMVAAETVDEMTKYFPYPRPRFYNKAFSLTGGIKKVILKKKEVDAVQEAFMKQGEYFPRVFFLFPHNGSVMPIFNSGVDSDPLHLNFYIDAYSLVDSMMTALKMMNEAVNFAEL